MSSGAAAAALLQRQLKEIKSSKDLSGMSCGLVDDNNIFKWEVVLMINDDCKYYGGMTVPCKETNIMNRLYGQCCKLG
jgi:ubiquitin-conjugating enzyme E2 G1